MTGRAGRRGLDSVGHAVVVWSPQVSMTAVAALATSPPPDLRSSFRLTYNLAVNLVRRYQRGSGPLHLGPLLRPVPRQPPSPRPVAPTRPRPGAARALRVRGPGRVAAHALAASCWRGSTTSPISSSPRRCAEGLFDGLDPPELAAVVSACTFETRPGRAPVLARRPRRCVPRLAAIGRRRRRRCAPRNRRRTCRAPAPPTTGSPTWPGGGRADSASTASSNGPSSRPGTSCATSSSSSTCCASWPWWAAPTPPRAARQAADLLQRGVVAASAGPALALDDDGVRGGGGGGRRAPAPGAAIPRRRPRGDAPDQGRRGSRGR